MVLANEVDEELSRHMGCEVGRQRPEMGALREAVDDDHDERGFVRIRYPDNEVEG